MWKNMHVIVAMLVAPLLAILAWFAVDYLVAERPHVAESGAAYPLIARSNRRYDSGRCDLENQDFQVSITPVDISSTRVSLRLSSRLPLQQATIGLAGRGAELLPVPMSDRNPGKTEWSAEIPAPTSNEAMLRVAVTSDDVLFFAEVPVVFLVIRE